MTLQKIFSFAMVFFMAIFLVLLRSPDHLSACAGKTQLFWDFQNTPVLMALVLGSETQLRPKNNHKKIY